MARLYDDDFANAPYIPGAEAYPPRWEAVAAEFRASARARLDQPYGAGERERLDLFLPEGAPRGLVVFVHGGYWRAFGREVWSHLARGPVLAGWAAALPSYSLAPAARISQITRQIAQAVDAAAEAIGGPVRLAGHSAGGHLVSRMLCGDVGLRCGGRLASCLPISPVADLRPLLQTTMNDDLRLDAEEAAAESPVLLAKARDVPFHVWVGGDERPAFVSQARALAAAWGAELTVEAGRHHFDVVEGLCEPQSAITSALLS